MLLDISICNQSETFNGVSYIPEFQILSSSPQDNYCMYQTGKFLIHSTVGTDNTDDNFWTDCSHLKTFISAKTM